ncbi:DUF997 family protein [Rosenbergiella epipactidis]|uniref:DUF997 family protein n=1 Tax=Rosenbergiella epipactidis TaxID=1544694 RepID=UPI001F4EAC6D|nr:DUF997 family protein [Rosenbergiella epipactidis]
MDPRFIQAHKEARWSLLLSIAWVLVWAVTAYTGGQELGLFGFPRWFEWSCLFAPTLFIFLCWMMVRYLFADLPLED